MRKPVLPIILAFICLSVWFVWPVSDPNMGWCEDKEISEVMICTESSCAYKMADESLDVNENGYEVGDTIEVCRKRKPK